MVEEYMFASLSEVSSKIRIVVVYKNKGEIF